MENRFTAPMVSRTRTCRSVCVSADIKQFESCLYFFLSRNQQLHLLSFTHRVVSRSSHLLPFYFFTPLFSSVITLKQKTSPLHVDSSDKERSQGEKRNRPRRVGETKVCVVSQAVALACGLSLMLFEGQAKKCFSVVVFFL